MDPSTHSRITPAEVVAEARRVDRKLRRTGGPRLGMVVVDYLQRLQPDASVAREPRHLQVQHAVQTLKSLALALNVPVWTASQLNRTGVGGAGGLETLRESDAIGNESDVVMLLHRPDRVDPARTGELEIKVEKNRSGLAGVTRTVSLQAHYCRLGDLAHQPGEGWAPAAG